MEPDDRPPPTIEQVEVLERKVRDLTTRVEILESVIADRFP
jgi:hypothetical protein